MKPLLIGQAPAKHGIPHQPFMFTRSGKFLLDLLGMDWMGFEQTFDLVNLLNKWPGSAGKGDKFPANKARTAARKLEKKLDGRIVVLVGRNVERAFEFKNMQPLVLYPWTLSLSRDENKSCEIALLPHPSGVNRWWNIPGNRARAARFLKTLL